MGKGLWPRPLQTNRLILKTNRDLEGLCWLTVVAAHFGSHDQDTACQNYQHKMYWVVGLSHIGRVFDTLSRVHTGGPSSKAFTRTDVVQKQFLQLCSFYRAHTVSAHDAASLCGVAVCVE